MKLADSPIVTKPSRRRAAGLIPAGSPPSRRDEPSGSQWTVQRALPVIRGVAILLLIVFFLFAHGCHLGDHDEELFTHMFLR